MTETNYAKVLYELNIAPEVTASANAILKAAPEVSEVLSSPVVSLKEKENVIDKIFPKEICNFMKVLCRYHKASLAQEIFKEYQEYYNKRHNILNAELFYVVAPKKEQLDGMKNFLCKKYHTKDVQIKQIEDKSLIGGFCIRVEDEEIEKIIKSGRELPKIAMDLIERANRNGGKDNIAVVLAQPLTGEVEQC